MVFVRHDCAPEDRKALIAVVLRTSSATLSLSAPEDPSNPFQLVVNFRIASSTQPGRPITICTSSTVFESSAQTGRSLDMLARGAFQGALIHTSDPERHISLGDFKLHLQDSNPPADLRERGYQFITIPGDGGEVCIAHPLPFSRIFKYEEHLKKDDLRLGETYKAGMHPGYIATLWWCWGDLEGDLKGKKLHAWQEGWDHNNVAIPSDEEVEKEGWVLGENPDELVFKDETKGGYAEFRIVE